MVLSERDQYVTLFFLAIERGIDPCVGDSNFGDCRKLAERYAQARAALGAECPSCEKGRLQRDWWEAILQALPDTLPKLPNLARKND